MTDKAIWEKYGFNYVKTADDRGVWLIKSIQTGGCRLYQNGAVLHLPNEGFFDSILDAKRYVADAMLAEREE